MKTIELEKTPVGNLVDVLWEVFGDENWDDSAIETATRVINFWQEYTPKPIDFTATTFRYKPSR